MATLRTYENVESSVSAEIIEEYPGTGRSVSSPWSTRHVPRRIRRRPPESSHAIGHIESRLDEFENNIRAAVDIGLENRNLLEQLHQGGNRIGFGAIHSLDQGRAQLAYPILYGYQLVEDEVVAGITELGVWGVGSTEAEAVSELQEELWALLQDLEETPPEKLGSHLTATLRTLQARILRDAVDA